jgi:cytochrome d ubiquinol oxidase subunit I
VPFGVEGLFFFLEAIFAGIYLWGWRRLPGWAHWWSGVSRWGSSRPRS